MHIKHYLTQKFKVILCELTIYVKLTQRQTYIKFILYSVLYLPMCLTNLLWINICHVHFQTKIQVFLHILELNFLCQVFISTVRKMHNIYFL